MKSWKIICVVALIGLLCVRCLAQVDTYWQGATGNWSSGSNWTLGEPTSADTAYIKNGGTALVTESGEECYSLRIAVDLGPTIGSVSLSGSGQLSVLQDETIGYHGTASFIQTGGTHVVGGWLRIAEQTYYARYELSGGALTANSERIYYTPGLTFVQSGGTHSVLDKLYLDGGKYELSGTGVLTASAMQMDANGFFTQTGGVNFPQDLIMEYGTSYQLSGGQLVLNGSAHIGYSKRSTSSFTLSGTGQVWSLGSDIGESIGSQGTGYFVQTGGTNKVQGGSITIGEFDSGDGSYIISDGLLDAGRIFVGPPKFPAPINRGGTGRLNIIGDAATIKVGDYYQNDLSTLELDINGISPINVTGSVTLDGYLDVEFLEMPTFGQSFTIISNDGTDPVIGEFIGKADGSIFTVFGPGGSTVDLYIDYDGGDGNDVVLFVPEPATLGLLLGGLALFRKRKTK